VAVLLGVLAFGGLVGCSGTPGFGFGGPSKGTRVEALIRQAETAYHREDFGKAEELYRQAVALDSKSVVALAGLGDCRIGQGKIAEGLKFAQEAIDLDANDYHGYAVLGSGLIDTDRLDAAETALRRAIDLNAKDSDSLGNLGVVYYKQGFMKLASGYFEKAVALDPNETWHWANLAAADWWLGESDEAKSHADRALALDDTNGQAHQYRAAVAIREDDKDLAVEEALLAVKYADDDAWSYGLLANAYANDLEWDEAAEAANKALALDPASERGLVILAFTKLKQGDYQAAISWANKALAENDEDAETYYTLGMAEHALGHLDSAIAAMSEAVRLDPGSAANKRELAGFNKEKSKQRAKIKALEAKIASARRALTAKRKAAARRLTTDSNASRLVDRALAYVRSAYSWTSANGTMVKWAGRHATVRVSASGKGWTNIYLYRESNGMWTVQEME
jgi:tetratricopeptide (TPR) repeat protein